MTREAAGEHAAPVVEVCDLEKVFTTASGAVPALGPLSMRVDAGAFVAVLGPSGCGKTTLLRLVADLLEPTAGTVRVLGHSPRDARLAREYGFVFQRPVLYEWRTVAGNVGLPMEIAGVDRSARAERVQDTLRLVGLDGRDKAMPRELSGGMQQRVALARAMSMSPQLLLMDEPFAALDEIRRERLNLELLRIWRETGVTVLFVTHDIEEAVFLADRVVVLSPAPGQVWSTLPITLARPRQADARSSPAFMKLVQAVREALRVPAGPTDGPSRLRGSPES